MGWINLPVTDGSTDIHAWPFLKQIRDAIGQRAAVAGNYWWPRPSRNWGATGVVPSGITATGFDDPDANEGDGWCPSDGIPWACAVGDDSTPTAGEWWLVIDDCDDPTKCVRTKITGWTETALTFEDISDQITAGYVESLASLEGKPYYIVGYSYATWWNERIMGGSWTTEPNDYEWAAGTIREYHDDPEDLPTITNPTTSSIRDDEKIWQTDEHVGRDLLVYADDKLRRVVVTANTRDTLTFATQSWTPDIDSEYIVIPNGGKGLPGKAKLRPFLWYTGLCISYASHLPTDELGFALIPASTVHIPGSNEAGTNCDGFDVQAWDADPWLDYPLAPADLLCGASPDKPYNVDIWKSIRSWQLAVESLCWSFVEAKDYEDEPWIPLLNPAALFKIVGGTLGENTFTTTITAVTGVGGGHTSNNVTVDPIDAPITPHNIYWSVTKANGDFKGGTGILTDSGTLVAYTPSVDQFDADTDVGLEITISFGWSRFQARTFKTMFPSACFIPDIVFTGDVPGVIDPPAINFAVDGCTGAGQWLRRLPSTKYIDRNIQRGTWTVDAVGIAQEGTETFVTGEHARYVGDNFGDPTVTSFGDTYPDANNVQVPYFDHFFNGVSDPIYQRLITRQLVGKATSGSTTQLTHAGRNWFNHGWFGGDVLHEETGTATGGSTTSLVDSGKTSGGPNCWITNTRFNGFSGSYVGFTMEVLISGSSFSDPAAVIAKRLITTGNGTTATWTWTEALPSTASGKSYRIREPQYRLNRYEGRQVRLERTDPTTFAVTTATTTILGNDDDTLFFTAIAFAVDQYTRYKILEPKIGGVFKWTGSAWEQSSGEDTSRLGVPVPFDFHRDPTENLPTYVKRYGKLLPGDVIGSEFFNELFATINALRWTRLTPQWVNPDEIANEKRGEETDTDQQYTEGPDGWNEFWTTGTTILVGEPGERHYQGVQEAWDLATPSFANPTSPPFSVANGENQGSGVRVGGYSKRTNKAMVNVPPMRCGLVCEVDWWVYATIDAGDHDPGDECVAFEFDIGMFTHHYYMWEFNGNATAENLKFRAMHKWDGETTPSGDLERLSTFLAGDIDEHAEIPTDPALTAGSCLTHPEPPYNDIFSTIESGWYAFEKFAVVRWDVAGGLTHVS